MSTQSSLLCQFSALLDASISHEEGLALLELVVQKLGTTMHEIPPTECREVKFETLKVAPETVQKTRDSSPFDSALSSPQELMVLMETMQSQVSTFLSKIEVEKVALRTHLSVLGTLAARYKQQADAAHALNATIKRELHTVEAAYLELQEIALSDKDTISELNRRTKAVSDVTDTEEQIHSLQKQLALRTADCNQLDSLVYSLQYQVKALTEQVKALQRNQKEHKESATNAEKLSKLNETLHANLAAALVGKKGAEEALSRERRAAEENLSALVDREKMRIQSLLEELQARVDSSAIVPRVLSAASKGERTAPKEHSAGCKRPRFEQEPPTQVNRDKTSRFAHDNDLSNASDASNSVDPIMRGTATARAELDAKILNKVAEWGERGKGLGAFLEKELGLRATVLMRRLQRMRKHSGASK